MENTFKTIREFKPTTAALKNKTTIFILILILISGGLISYKSLAKALFPEIVMPTILVRTPYPGNSPLDIENLITRPLEREINTIKGIKELKSNSIQDNSSIFVEFNTDVDVNKALLDVKDAVDRTKKDLPTDLEIDPIVTDIDFSEIPIITVNISGDYSNDDLKKFAEYLEERIEDLPEINKAEIRGVLEKEVKINVDLHKMEANEISFDNIENAVRSENKTISGGDLLINGTLRTVRIEGQFKKAKELEDVIVKHQKGNIVYLKDIAEVVSDYESPKSIARLNNKPVVSVEVIKKSGENILSATDSIYKIIERAKVNRFPEGLDVVTTNDQSVKTRTQLNDLENSIITGMLFVIMVLYFFLGLRNALFVGFAIPMSMFIAFLVFGLMNVTLNMVVLFSFILALGMLVDNAIVVIENMYRLYEKGDSSFKAAKEGVGEIAIPIISSTATTLAAFVPLLFWKELMGEFMKFIPITLIIVLSSSLFVALILNPVIASVFIKLESNKASAHSRKKIYTYGAVFIGGAILFIIGLKTLGSLMVLFGATTLLNMFVFKPIAIWFQLKFLPKLELFYLWSMDLVLAKGRPGFMLVGVFLVLFLSIGILKLSAPKLEFFPVNMPSFINVFVETPIGSDIYYTDSITALIEKEVYAYMKPHKHIISSIISNVGAGTSDPKDGPSQGSAFHKARIKVSFKEFKHRKGVNTSDIMKGLSSQIGRYPGVMIRVDKNREGPPVGKPINIEVSGEDFNVLLELTAKIKKEIENSRIPGVEGLKMDLDIGKPELLVTIDRKKAKRFGVSTAQLGANVRTALFGKELSKLKDGEEEYPIILRLDDRYRYNWNALLNQKVTYRNKMNGKIVQVPASALMSFEYDATYGSVNRKDMERLITLSSNVKEGYNANSINLEIKDLLKSVPLPDSYSIQFTGEQKEQGKAIRFLSRALMIAVAMIWLILLAQFNSFFKPIIIVLTVLFSTIGVFLGLAITGMDIVVVMTGIGTVSLAGIVVNNAIVLIDYIDLVKKRRKESLNVNENQIIDRGLLVECIKEGGKTRLRPVLLTAITTVLGLIPLAIGLNINFYTLFTDLDPQIYLGGDNTVFWSPMAWTVIYGLVFSTFLTLVVVPTLYLISERLRSSLHVLFYKKEIA
ncbi:MAG TPA: efflux RND transporter permease subunit [Bacteroidetes bacterium]|nr:efflux RND transporter permease subunit [Bacteroidota bacterium]